MGEPKLKILECDDKDVLRMPSGAVHLWLFYRMYADQLEESYFSVRTIAGILGQDTKTVIKWQEYLINCGRLIKTGEVAANRYSRPSRGSHQVPVVRVTSVGNIPTLETPNNTEESCVGESYCRNNSYKGSTPLCSGSTPLSSPRLCAVPLYSANEKYPQSGAEIQKMGENLEPKPKTKGDLKFEQEHGGITRAEWDDHDQAWHTKKLIELGISKEGVSEFKPHGNGHGNGSSVPKKKAKSKQSLNEFLNEGNPPRLGDRTAADWEALERDMFGEIDSGLDDFGDKIIDHRGYKTDEIG
jgi:hypothetical protein